VALLVGSQVIDFKLFSAAQQVTYTFFVGRLSVFDDDYLKAEEMLTYALEHCHKAATHNKRVILSYLIPVRMLRGKLPSPALLEKHSLQDFLPLVHAMKLGNVKLLNETLLAQQVRAPIHHPTPNSIVHGAMVALQRNAGCDLPTLARGMDFPRSIRVQRVRMKRGGRYTVARPS
jgi:hypothetical protein